MFAFQRRISVVLSKRLPDLLRATAEEFRRPGNPVVATLCQNAAAAHNQALEGHELAKHFPELIDYEKRQPEDVRLLAIAVITRAAALLQTRSKGAWDVAGESLRLRREVVMPAVRLARFLKRAKQGNSPISVPLRLLQDIGGILTREREAVWKRLGLDCHIANAAARAAESQRPGD